MFKMIISILVWPRREYLIWRSIHRAVMDMEWEND